MTKHSSREIVLWIVMAPAGGAVFPVLQKVLGPVLIAVGIVMALSDIGSPRDVPGAAIASALMVVGIIHTMTVFRSLRRRQTVGPQQ
jgi:hypothetical protein